MRKVEPIPIHGWIRVEARIFHHFHHCWITALSDTLNRDLLPPDFYALAEQIAGGLGPDVLTLESRRRDSGRSNGNNNDAEIQNDGGGIALAASPPQVRFTAEAEMDQYARKRNRVVIRHSSEDRVAVIEIVSPCNKGSGHALRSFVNKAVELLEAGIHLLVLDLFPPGPRDPQRIHHAIWSEISDSDFRLPPDKPLTLVGYSAGELKRAFIEPVAVGDALPDMPLFLEPGLYLPAPLEQTYGAAFENVPRRWRVELE